MDKKPWTYESAFARLEEVTRALESGSCPLADSLSLFEEGTGLVSFLQKELSNAEQKVTTIHERIGL